MELDPMFIREYYDANPDITLLELSFLTGCTIPDLKIILMEDDDETVSDYT
jgi:hypothetical protein